MKTLKLLVMLLFIVMLSAFAFGETNVNITLRETVNQNVTFAQDFDLVENQTYSLIEGEIEVDNPGSETIFDIYVRLGQVSEIIDGRFYWRATSDREGYQVVYPGLLNVSDINKTIPITFLDLEMDLDEDGTNDLVTVNDSHIIFNLTSEPYLYSYEFEDSGVVTDITVPGRTINMTFNIVSSERQSITPLTGVQYASVTIFGTNNIANTLNGTGPQLNITINDSQRSVAVLHIPEIRSGQSVFYDYNVSLTNILPPLDVNVSYYDNIFPTKVLAGNKFNNTITVKNQGYVPAPIQSVNITIETLGVNVTNLTNPLEWEVFNFTIHDIQSTGDYKNVYAQNSSADWLTVYNNATTVSNRTWNWITNGGIIPHLNSYNFSYSILAPETVPTSDSYESVKLSLAYTVPTTASNLSVTEVRAGADVDFTETKRIISPASSSRDYNVTWQSIASITTESGINFTLEEVSQWVTTTLDPNNRSSGYNLNKTFAVNGDLNSGTPWTSSGAGPFTFNFTEGTNGTDVPIIWIKPYWIIKNADSQIVNQSISVNGTDIYIMSVYVVHGYFLQVDKNITNMGNNTYRIYTNVVNLGNGHTPQNQTVTIYDFVPAEFTAWNWTGEGAAPDASENVTGQFEGVAYRWDVGIRTNLSTSFSPKNDPDGYDVWNVSYYVNGTGDYKVSELYIVGLDPRNLDGVYGSPVVNIFSGLKSGSKEFIWILVVLGLIIINIGNFVMTRQINRKIDDRFRK